VVEAYYYTNCTLTMTAMATVYFSDTSFTADPITFQFANPETPLLLEWQYPSVTITSFTPLETLIFVSISFLETADFRRNNSLLEAMF
jgi:hypothetical protein